MGARRGICKTHVDDLLETADALGIERADWLGHSIGGRLVAEVAARAPDRVARAVLLDPAMQIETAVALQRVELLRPDTSFASRDDAIDTRLADPLLYSTPRSMLEQEAVEHLALGDDGRYRWRGSPGMAIVAWSEMTTVATAVAGVPDAGRRRRADVDPVPRPRASNVEVTTVPGGHSVLWDDFDATADAIDAFPDLVIASGREAGALQGFARSEAAWERIRSRHGRSLAMPGLRRAARADEVPDDRSLRVLDAVRRRICADKCDRRSRPVRRRTSRWRSAAHLVSPERR